MKIRLSTEAMDQMLSWLESAYPHEACGFMVGSIEDEVRNVTRIVSVKNISSDNLRRRFVIHPLDYMKAERAADDSGDQLLGVFHSHPDHPAIPSEHDLASAQPFFSYLIASVRNGARDAVRSYRLNDNQFEEEQLIIGN